MLEKIMCAYLSTALSPVHVGLVVPEEPPAKYVVFERTRSGESDMLKSAVLAFRSAAPTLQEAAELNELLVSAVKDSVALAQISSAKLNTAYNNTDPNKKEYRWQAVFDITYYD